MNYTWTPPVIEPNPIQEEAPCGEIFPCWIGNTVAFNRGKQVLAIVLIEAVRMAVKTIREIVKLSPACVIAITADDNYSIELSYWKGDAKIGVVLLTGHPVRPLGYWDLDEIDPF